MPMHWCLGMYGSASTWTFYLVQKLATAMAPERPLHAMFVADALGAPQAPEAIVVLKSHAAPAVDVLSARATAILITIRDPRDAVASLMAHNRAPFDLALRATAATTRICGRFATDPRALLLRFEDRFFDDPQTIPRIAATLPGLLSDADRDRIFAETRRGAIDSFIAGLATLPTAQTGLDALTGQQDLFDPVTGWHRHHAGRSGETGRWQRELTAAQAHQIEAALLPWMVRFGYAGRR